MILAAAQSTSTPGDIASNVAHHLRFAAIAAEHGVQLLVFPELSLTGYELALAPANVIEPDSPVLDPLRRLAAEARMTIVAGAPVRSDRQTLHIGALAIRPQGPVVTHTKEHTHYSEEGVFRPGRGGPVLPVEEARVALAICADARRPEHAATAARRGATVYAASVMIIEEEYGPKAALLVGYARRHRMAVLLANYSGATGGSYSAGKSALWSEDGLVVAASGGTEEALVVGSKHDGVWTGTVLPLSAQMKETAHGWHAFTVENKE